VTEDDRAKLTLERWRLHPAAMVREEFHVEPDLWQEEALEAFPNTNRLALKACKGPGKTAVLAWLILNFLATRPHPRIAATSITGDNLDSNLWPELSKWMQVSPFLAATFRWAKTSVEHRLFPSTWWCQARTWPRSANAEQQANALAGLHADYAMGVLDESSEIPQAVMATVEAVLATGVETKVLQAGNPTRLDGPLYTACVRERHLWVVVTITGDPDNPKRSPRISLEYARQQIASYGRDNPWVKTNVLGEFPETSINALLGVEEVTAAMGRHLRIDAYEWAQRRLGVDVARFGDDRTVIFPRQGLAAFRPLIRRNMRTTDIAACVAKAAADWKAEVIFVDDTGHWGHGVIDNLIAAGIDCIPLVYHAKALNPRYKNRRCEFWLEGAKWVKEGGALPNIPELVAELTTPTYTFVGGVFVLEEKAQIKERLGRSPDLADALFETFAIPDQPNEAVMRHKQRATATHEFEPFERAEDDFDPYEGRNR
jgi:hypothetical protein